MPDQQLVPLGERRSPPGEAGQVIVNAALHPFHLGERVQAMAPEGLSLAEILGEAAPVFSAWLDGAPIPREQWALTFPRAGQIVEVRLLPQSGKMLGAILQIGIMAAGAIVSGGALGGAFAAGSWGASLLSAGIGLVGKLLLAALIPPQQPASPASQEFDRRPGIGPASNQINRYGVVPSVFGRRRIYPPYAAMPYSELVGNDQYVRMLFAVGLGEYDVSDEKIGDTDLSEYEHEIEYGDFADPPALFTQDIYEDTPGATLRGEVISKAIGIGGSTPVSGSDTAEDLHEAVRTAQPLADELSIDLLFDQGLFSIDEVKGKTRWSRAEVVVEFSPTGADTWTNFLAATGKQRSGPIYYPGETPPNCGYSVPAGSAVYIISEKRETLRVGFRWRVTPGTYDVRIQYPEYVANNDTVDEPKGKPFTWSALRTIRHQAPTHLPGTKLVAVRIKATNEGSVAERFNLVVQRKLPIWNGTSWSAPTATRRAAWAYAEALTGAPGNSRAIDKSRLDATALKAWADADAAAGLTYDDIVDEQTTVLQQLRTIAGAVLAAWAIQDGKYTVIREGAQTVPVQMFTPRNSWGFSAKKDFTRRPHALRVQFVDPVTWAEDERTVYDDGYTEANATIFETLQTRGVASAAQAWKIGRRHLAQLRLRPETYTLNADFEHLCATRGDLVRVAHDVMLVGMSWGRVKSLVLGGGGAIAGFVGDEPLTMQPGERYGMRVRRTADGDFESGEVANDALGETAAFTFLTPLAADSIAIGDLYAAGLLGLETAEYVITRIQPGENLTAQLTLVDAAPALLSAETGPIPDFVSSITQPRDLRDIVPPAPVITGIRSDELACYRDDTGRLREQAIVAFRFGGRVGLPSLEVEGRFAPASAETWSTVGAVPATDGVIRFTGVEGGAAYTFQLRARNGTNTSAWVAQTETVIGLTTPPPDVLTLYLEGTRLRWTYPTPPPDLTGFQVRSHFGENSHWASAAPAHDGLLLASVFDIGALGSGTRTIMVKARDLGEKESVNAAILVKDLGDPVTANAVETIDHRGDSWPGTVTNGTEDSGDLAADDDGSLFWSMGDSGPFWPADDADLFWAVQYQAMTYVAELEPDPDWLVDGKLLLDLEVEASAWTVEYRIDGGAYLSWPGRLDSLVDGTYEFRVTTAAGPVQGRIVQMKIIVDLPNVTEELEDVAISSGGTRLPITKTYRAIKSVQLTVQQDGNGATSARVFDKDETLGPLVKATNAAGTAVNGVLDATIIGY